MPKKRKNAGVDDKCRICLGDDGCMSDIFSDDIKPKINHLGDSTSIHINDDDVLSPKNICHVCLYKLDMWIEFKDQFLRSNAMLREHLGLCQLSNDATTNAKRKRTDTDESPDAPSVEHLASKKIKSDEATKPVAENSENGKNTWEKCEPTEKTEDTKNVAEAPRPSEKLVSTENETSSRRLALPKIQTSTTPYKRVKTTDRREASTKRWVARKRALLAATGENETDTDSETSEESRLSTVRKPRGKSIAREKIPDTRRTSKSSESENDKTRMKMSVQSVAKTSKNDDKSNPSDKEKMEKKMMVNDESNLIDLLPRSLRSELIVDDATYVVTSTLVLTETPRNDDPSTTTEESTRRLPIGNPDERNQDRNTDIIDAVQLRRVPAKLPPSRSAKKFIERCLNIEIEGTELEALRRVQSSLARYVETKLITNLHEDDGYPIKIENHVGISLDRRVNEIVERTVKKNAEASRIDGTSMSSAGIRGSKTFTREFVRAAIRSRIFQPRVMLCRCPDNLHRRNSDNRRDLAMGKRRSVKPAKYADYEGGSSLNSAGEEDFRDSTSKFDLRTDKSSKIKTYGPAMAKQPLSNVKHRENEPEAMKNRVKHSISTPTMNRDKSVVHTASIILNDENARANIEKHICGVCGDSFATRKQVEMHFSAHKSAAAIARRGREKMMRCKRCHVIVEARYVKSHVCESTITRYECYSCGAKFHSDEMLVQHLETHATVEKSKIIKITENPREHSRSVTTISTKKQHNAIGQVGGEISDTSYTCFVCDKIFRDEQILKDHLQKHCDDMSEDEPENREKGNEEEPSDDKEQYQCAICGETMESEDALESHVEKHLFDEDEDENPNLISIVDGERTPKNNDNDGTMIHGCDECSEKFHSEMLLMLHQQAHEEEAAIAEWERRGIDNSIAEQHMCVICDQLFANEAELSEHLDIHNGNAHVCLLCDKPFITLEELQAHVDTH